MIEKNIVLSIVVDLYEEDYEMIKRLVGVYARKEGWARNEARAMVGDFFCEALLREGILND